jgi:hypothetical protein
MTGRPEVCPKPISKKHHTIKPIHHSPFLIHP